MEKCKNSSNIFVVLQDKHMNKQFVNIDGLVGIKQKLEDI